MELREVNIDQIHGWDERDAIPEKLARIKESIKKEGQKESIEVSVEARDSNELHPISFTGQDGKHRYLAMKQLGCKKIKCIIR